MPIAIKKQLAHMLSGGFVLKRAVFNPCLELYPMKEWTALMEKVNGLNRFNKKNNDFIRRFTAGVKTVEMDVSGRLLIPKGQSQAPKQTDSLKLICLRGIFNGFIPYRPTATG